jgi:hypothetical protein
VGCSHAAVLRFNFAPTSHEYEPCVGKKTTFRVLNVRASEAAAQRRFNPKLIDRCVLRSVVRTAMKKLRIVILVGFGTARQKRVLE